MARLTAARRAPAPPSDSESPSPSESDSADSIADTLQPVPAKRGRKTNSSAGRSSTSSQKRRKSTNTDHVSEDEEQQLDAEEAAPAQEEEEQQQPEAEDQDIKAEEAQPTGPAQTQQQPKSEFAPLTANNSPTKPSRLASQAPKSPSPTKPRVRQLSAFPEKPAAPKPRLTIHKIVLINFKSYAGVVNIGPFHASFSAIVGPNGSGKSNTIDALLFVFGFKASKMRQGKLSELIHNSDQFQDLDFCSVEVHFREIIDLDTPVPEGQPPLFDVVPGTELVVARTAYRNNTSKYTVNNRTSNYKDVTTLLKGKGIDLDHKRFLILQGEVESIALMKPKGATEHEDGLLEYLEDIIGTDRFKEPLEQANKEVEELNDQRTHAMNRVKVVEHEKAMLEPRKREAESYLRDQNQLAIASSKLFQYNRWAIEQVISEGKHRLGLAEKHLEEERQKQADIRKDFEETQAAFDESAAEVKTVEEEAKGLQKELAAFEKQDIQLQEQKKHFSSKYKKVKKAIQDDTHARSSASTTVKDKASEVETYNKDIEKLESQLDKEEKELDAVRESLKDKTSHLSEQIEVKQAELAPWKTKLSEARNRKSVVQNERDLVQQRIESAQKNIDEAKQNLKQLEQQKREGIDSLESLRAEESSARQQAGDIQRKLEALKGHSEAARSKASSAKSKMDEARATQSANTSRSKVLTDLTKLRDQGRLDGFYGRLGDLGRIDDKYDVAISTAAPGLNNLVCDAVETGQKCLDQLRRTKSGRATIMCLDKMQNRSLAPINTPENVPRLFDLVTPKDSKFASAFYEVLKDTLVATDLTQANRIAFGAKRWRVVTLDGKLIDTSGTMAGGGSRVIRGLMGSKVTADDVRPEQMARLERDASEAEHELRKIVEDQSELETKFQFVQRKPSELRMQIQKVEMTVKSCDKRLQDCRQRIEELSSQVTPEDEDLERIAQLDETLEKIEKELAKLSKQSDPIEAEIKRLQDEILAVGGTKLRVQQTKVSDIKDRLELLSDRLTKAQVAGSKADKDVVKLDKALEINRAAEEELESELDELEKKISRNNIGSENFRSQVEAVQATLEEAREGLTERKTELDAISGQMKKFRAEEAKLEQECTKIKDELAENDRKLAHWQHSLDQLRLHEVDDESDDEDASPNPTKEEDPEKAAEKRAADELRDYSESELEDMDPNQLKADKAVLEERVEKAKPNLEVLKEYRRREAEFLKRIADSDAILEKRDQAKQTYDKLRKQRLEEFMDGFSQISLKLKEMYQMITMGGNAELELVDSLDPFSEGIVFSVMPPKKSWRNISNLSGGEKTLSSLALVFALHAFKPTPLYFMDEIDAALDFRNVSIVANYIAQRTKNAQFIIISLRNNMFELASRLVGIYKTANCTKSVTISNTNLATA